MIFNLSPTIWYMVILALTTPSVHSFVIHPKFKTFAHPAIRADLHSGLRKRPCLGLNRILLELEEVSSDSQSTEHHFLKGRGARAFLPMDDSRVQHVALILRARDGDQIRAGVLDVGACDNAEVSWKWPEGYREGWDADRAAIATGPLEQKAGAKQLGAERSRMRPGKVKQKVWPLGLELKLLGSWVAEPMPRPRVDLLLALPRPLQLARMLPAISQLGVGTIILSSASKVEPDYFGSHLIRDPASMRALLIEGLAQSGDVHVPRVVIAKRLKVFLEDDLDALLPRSTSKRLVAHPYAIGGGAESRRVMAVPPPPPPATTNTDEAIVTELATGAFSNASPGDAEQSRVLVAVGPEGGWDGAGHELSLLAAAGFEPVGLGQRVLRSDVAVSVLLGLAHGLVESWDATSNDNDDDDDGVSEEAHGGYDDLASFYADLAC